MTEKNKSHLKKFMDEIWNGNNLEVTEDFVHFPYTIYHDPGDPWEGQALDLQTFKERVTNSRLVFPDLHFTCLEFVSEGDKVALNWFLEGTQKGEIKGFIPATRKRVKVSGFTLYSFTNGKISGHWQIVDRLGFIQQVQ